MKKVIFLLLAFFAFSAPLRAEDLVLPRKVLVFDFGDVIVKSDKSALANYLQEFFHIDEEELIRVMQDFRAARAARVPEPVFWQRYAEERGIDFPEDWVERYEEVKLSSLSYIEGMREMIKSYKDKGYRIALFSNTGCSHSSYLREYGYYDDFSPIILSFEIGANKPDPKAYQVMLSILQIPAEDCIFIDDKKENVEAAIVEGIDAIQFSSFEQVRSELELRTN